jgi:hypothetical protein
MRHSNAISNERIPSNKFNAKHSWAPTRLMTHSCGPNDLVRGAPKNLLHKTYDVTGERIRSSDTHKALS